MREPKPRFCGGRTTGPPLSTQSSEKPFSLSLIDQAISTRPSSVESAPYLTAFVASS